MSRGNVTDLLAAIQTSMEADMVGDGKPLVELKDYVETNFNGMSPVGIVVRNNTRLRRLTARGNRVIYRLYVHFFVLKVDPANTDYTLSDAEYALNACTDSLMDWVETNRSRRDLGWQNITSEQDSFLRSVVDDGGNSYWMETYMFEVEVW